MALPFENRGGKDYYINWSRIAAMTARLAQPRSPAHALHSLVPCRREGRFCVKSLSSTPVVRAAACDVPASAYAHGEQGHESGRVSERRYVDTTDTTILDLQTRIEKLDELLAEYRKTH